MVGKRFKKEPLAANPSNAILTTMNAKWYQRDTEKILVRDTSRRRAAALMEKMPQYTERIKDVQHQGRKRY